MKKIIIYGAGYVGLSLACVFSQKYKVVLIDIDKKRIEQINQGKSPLKENDIKEILSSNENLIAATKIKLKSESPDFIFLCLPTTFVDDKKTFDTSILENEILKISNDLPDTPLIIKSTVPIGFTRKITKKTGNNNIFFSPEFLREGSSIQDNLYPSRIIVGHVKRNGKSVVELIRSISKNNPDTKILHSDEAEAVKLFSNTYLALRIAFFNELDSFALSNNLNAKEIIDGLSKDTRIGNHYNNPSFGYGGYCLPKDTKQLLSNFDNIPQKMISAIVESNTQRKRYISGHILKNYEGIIGIYKLVMKKGSDNYRDSSVIDIIEELKNKTDNILIYEPLIKLDIFRGVEVINNIEEFKSKCSIIIANRYDNDLEDVYDKVFSRDIFGVD